MCKQKDEIENEELNIFQYVEKMKKDGHEGLEVQSCGFLTSKTHRLGWLR